MEHHLGTWALTAGQRAMGHCRAGPKGSAYGLGPMPNCHHLHQQSSSATWGSRLPFPHAAGLGWCGWAAMGDSREGLPPCPGFSHRYGGRHLLLLGPLVLSCTYIPRTASSPPADLNRSPYREPALSEVRAFCLKTRQAPQRHQHPHPQAVRTGDPP